MSVGARRLCCGLVCSLVCGCTAFIPGSWVDTDDRDPEADSGDRFGDPDAGDPQAAAVTDDEDVDAGAVQPVVEPPPPITLATRTMVGIDGHVIESITAYGRYWNFDLDADAAPWASNGAGLGEVAHYANGPCAGLGAFDCRFDSRAIVVVGGHAIESITAYGRYWNFDVDDGGAPWASNGSDLGSVAHYASGPCAGRAAYSCTFDTRTVVPNAGHSIESITAYGRYWNFDLDANLAPWATNGQDLCSVGHYATGPCAGREALTCTFDSRAIVVVEGHTIESITAYGRYWNFDLDDGLAPWESNGSLLTDVPRYRDGPGALAAQ